MDNKILTRCAAFVLILALCVQITPRASAALANPGDTATAENVLEVLRQYDAGAYHIMKTEYDSGINFLLWFSGGQPIISNIDTAVHETYHGYTHRQANTFYGERIYLGGGKYYDVDYSVVYGGNFTKTEEMTRSIPVELQTARYYGYIAPGNYVTANTQGVFGLLDEFTAYYWGLETMNSLAQYLVDTDAGAEAWRYYNQKRREQLDCLRRVQILDPALHDLYQISKSSSLSGHFKQRGLLCGLRGSGCEVHFGN